MTRKGWYTVVAIVVLAVLGVTSVAIHLAGKRENERAMIYQLQQLRYAVQIFVKVHRKTPPTWAAAMDAQYNFGQPFRWKFKRDATGSPIDPFGTPYDYDPKSGWISSRTEDYEEW